MQKNEMDRTGSIIIKICIFSIILSLTALLLSAVFNYWTNADRNANTSINEMPVVVIDAGHGGVDGGAVAKDGTKEKDLNLAIALSVKDMLETSGIEVVMTRQTDEMLGQDEKYGSRKMQDLKKRLDIVNDIDNCVFVSLHMNKFSQSKYSGVQVFYSKNNDKSSVLAETIQKNIKNYIQSDNEREIKKAGSNIFILDNIKTTGVLVECGFLSNEHECELLKSEEYRKELASVIYLSVVEFLTSL